jgi:hypothetical protein
VPRWILYLELPSGKVRPLCKLVTRHGLLSLIIVSDPKVFSEVQGQANEHCERTVAKHQIFEILWMGSVQTAALQEKNVTNFEIQNISGHEKLKIPEKQSCSGALRATSSIL